MTFVSTYTYPLASEFLVSSRLAQRIFPRLSGFLPPLKPTLLNSLEALETPGEKCSIELASRESRNVSRETSVASLERDEKRVSLGVNRCFTVLSNFY